MSKQHNLNLLHEDIGHNLAQESYLSYNKHLIEDKVVLDLGCHTGISTSIIQGLGANFVYGVEARKELVEKAKNRIQGNVNFFVGDVQDKNLISPLVDKSQNIIMLGLFYHLYNHFGLFSQILRPNIDHVLIETVAGPETVSPAMAWGFENTNYRKNGWHAETKNLPHGTPNLAWILKSAELFGFYCDWVYSYATGGELPAKTRYNITEKEYIDIKQHDWPQYEKIKSKEPLPNAILQDIKTKLFNDEPEQAGNKRQLIRLYNSNNIKADPIKVEDCYIWHLHQKQSKLESA